MHTEQKPNDRQKHGHRNRVKDPNQMEENEMQTSARTNIQTAMQREGPDYY